MAATAARDLVAARVQADQLADARTQAAAALQRLDAEIAADTAQLESARAELDQLETELAQAKAAFSALLPMMLRLSNEPVATVLTVPAAPDDALRGLLITRGLAINLNLQASQLRARAERVAKARSATEAEQANLAKARETQATRAAALEVMVAQARDQVTQAEADGRLAAGQVAAAAAAAKSLRDAIAAMDEAAARGAARAEREASAAEHRNDKGTADTARARAAALTRPEGPPLSQSAGQLVVPVAGPVVKSFGAAAEDGPATGLTYAAAPGAFVESPCRGRVAFAAPFRSYGKLLILECGGGYDIVLAGLGEIGAVPGQAVRAGEPLGRMPQEQKSGLYVELRAKGKPVDPAPFLKARL